MCFHERLQQARFSANLTQDNVRELMQTKGYPIQSNTVSNWESGRQVPSAVELLELCDLYGIADIRYELTGKHSLIPFSPLDGLNQEGKENAHAYIGFLKNNPVYTEKPGQSELGIFRLKDLPVSAGSGVCLDSFDDEDFTTDGLLPDDTEVDDYCIVVDPAKLNRFFGNARQDCADSRDLSIGE